MKYTEKDLYDFMDSGRQILLTTTDGLQFKGQCWAYCEIVSREEFGFDEPLKSLFKKYKNSEKHLIYLSYDIDINDPSFAPGTGTPEAFGLSSRMVLELIMGLFENLNIKAFDIVEVSPTLDCNDITSWLALKTLYEVLNILKEKL